MANYKIYFSSVSLIADSIDMDLCYFARLKCYINSLLVETISQVFCLNEEEVGQK